MTAESRRPVSGDGASDRLWEVARLKSQIVTSKGRGDRRCAPYAFTEQGVAMLSSLLRSERAILVSERQTLGRRPRLA